MLASPQASHCRFMEQQQSQALSHERRCAQLSAFIQSVLLAIGRQSDAFQFSPAANGLSDTDATALMALDAHRLARLQNAVGSCLDEAAARLQASEQRLVTLHAEVCGVHWGS